MKNNNNSTASILAVDDTHANLQLLVKILARQGYKVRPAVNGRMALKAAQAEPPDLILLDIMMPEMDGYELCQHLKANPQTRDIPIIFISALDETFDKVKAFSIGAVDYITKPFQEEEVLARINTHLTIRNLQQDLQQQVAELDAFAHTVAHDLKNPLTVILGYSEILTDTSLALTQKELQQSLDEVQKTTHRALNIISELLLLAETRKEDVTLKPLNMGQVVAQAQERLEPLRQDYHGHISLPKSWPTALGYAPWIEEVWMNYLSNGLKYGGRPPRLELGSTPQPNGLIRFWVLDNGPGITPQEQATLFTEFTRLNQVRLEGHGLGLSIVRRIIEKVGGQVGVESQVGQGSTFYFCLAAHD